MNKTHRGIIALLEKNAHIKPEICEADAPVFAQYGMDSIAVLLFMLDFERQYLVRVDSRLFGQDVTLNALAELTREIHE